LKPFVFFFQISIILKILRVFLNLFLFAFQVSIKLKNCSELFDISVSLSATLPFPAYLREDKKKQRNMSVSVCEKTVLLKNKTGYGKKFKKAFPSKKNYFEEGGLFCLMNLKMLNLEWNFFLFGGVIIE
jgi:hypothetical protein